MQFECKNLHELLRSETTSWLLLLKRRLLIISVNKIIRRFSLPPQDVNHKTTLKETSVHIHSNDISIESWKGNLWRKFLSRSRLGENMEKSLKATGFFLCSTKLLLCRRKDNFPFTKSIPFNCQVTTSDSNGDFFPFTTFLMTMRQRTTNHKINIESHSNFFVYVYKSRNGEKCYLA